MGQRRGDRPLVAPPEPLRAPNPDAMTNPVWCSRAILPRACVTSACRPLASPSECLPRPPPSAIRLPPSSLLPAPPLPFVLLRFSFDSGSILLRCAFVSPLLGIRSWKKHSEGLCLMWPGNPSPACITSKIPSAGSGRRRPAPRIRCRDRSASPGSVISPRPGIRFQRLDDPEPIVRWPLPDEPARTSDSRPDPIGLGR
jgi:hypothetical protein